MKIYIAGKITGDPYYKAKFARAAADIADAGHTPINPAMQPEGMSNADYMRISFAQLDSADAVAFLPDWEDSKGARIEHLLVEYTGKPTYDIKSARLMVLPESKEHSRKTRQEWISVKDRLPKNDEIVIICTDKNFIYAGELIGDTWFLDNDSWTATVTHWMPLPQPPKGE